MNGKPDKSIGRLLALASRLYRARIGERLQVLGLFPGQEQVLEVLAMNGPMQMGELAERLSVRPPTVSKTIARLSAQGLVRRSAAGGDGRLVQVQLTEEGQTRAAMLAGLIEAVEREMLEELDGKDRKRLRKGLRKVARTLASAGGRQAEAGDDEADEDEDEAREVPAA
jgi:DNA-binding MarR family transcriptional regulator